MPTPAFVGLQEVTAQWAAHLRPKLVAGGFHGLHCQQPPQPYFVALATRPPLSALRDVTTLDYHRTMMGRALVYGRATRGPALASSSSGRRTSSRSSGRTSRRW